jgi:ribosomal protein L11 methyltransferase
MTWCAVEIVVPPGSRDAVGRWLVGATGQAIEERADGTLVGFLQDAANVDQLQSDLERQFDLAAEVTPRPLDPVDWSERWREGLGPRRFGRLIVTPSWVPQPPADGTAVVVLDPETAFGSGEHGSTRAVLAILERWLRPGARVLDLGSGSGILSIAAAKLGAASATGIELDEEANPVARHNAERNGVAGQVRFVDGEAGLLLPLLAPADLILSNILRQVNLALLEPIHGALAPGGIAIFSGMERDEASLFRPALLAAGFALLEEVEDEGWWAVAVVGR